MGKYTCLLAGELTTVFAGGKFTLFARMFLHVSARLFAGIKKRLQVVSAAKHAAGPQPSLWRRRAMDEDRNRPLIELNRTALCELRRKPSHSRL